MLTELLRLLLVVIAAEERMSYFMAGVTNVNPETKPPVYGKYRHVRYNKTLPASATGSVSFPPSPSHQRFRYVIIQQKYKNNDAICIAEVKVFLRGTCTLYE